MTSLREAGLEKVLQGETTLREVNRVSFTGSRAAMPLFPVHRPTIGLSISGERLTLVELHRGWRPGRRDTSLRHADERDLPSGLVRPSASDRNLSDVPALAQEVRALLGTRRTL